MSEPDNEQNQIVSRNLKRLIRGLTQDDLSETYEGYKVLFQIGASVIPQVREVLLKFDCSKVKFPNEIRYVSGLVNLVHDIDEVEANNIVQQLKGGGCNPALARILDSICKFTIDDYARYNVCGVEIFEHKNLITNQNVKAKLESWLKNVPSDDLREIERIYILRREDLESLGNYKPILYRINLVWINSSSRWSPMSCIDNFIIENTLYHEIGHHVCRHTFGQDPKQEKEADDYADRIMLNSNHLLFRIARLFKAQSNKSLDVRAKQRPS